MLFRSDELNEIVSKRVAQVKSKYQDIDPAEFRELRSLREQIEEEQLIKRQDFETLLKKNKEKADTEISSLRTELTRIKVDGALMASASKAKAVAPDQVARLLKESVRLESDGKVTVLDEAGSPRYTDDAEPMSVDALVEEFLNRNQHYRSAGPAGTGSASNNATANQQKLDLASLDMTRPEHRELFKKWRATGKL